MLDWNLFGNFALYVRLRVDSVVIYTLPGRLGVISDFKLERILRRVADLYSNSNFCDVQNLLKRDSGLGKWKMMMSRTGNSLDSGEWW